MESLRKTFHCTLPYSSRHSAAKAPQVVIAFEKSILKDGLEGSVMDRRKQCNGKLLITASSTIDGEALAGLDDEPCFFSTMKQRHVSFINVSIRSYPRRSRPSQKWIFMLITGSTSLWLLGGARIGLHTPFAALLLGPPAGRGTLGACGSPSSGNSA